MRLQDIAQTGIPLQEARQFVESTGDEHVVIAHEQDPFAGGGPYEFPQVFVVPEVLRVLSEDHLVPALTRYTSECRYEVIFRENPQNLGYDKNLRELIRAASGEWVLFMGNDDMFVAGALDKLAGFLKGNPGLGYVLKSHYLIHKNNKYESHRYYDGNSFFDPGIGACVSLFRKSVFISGFLIRREFVLPYLTDEVDGTLLFQLYLLGEVVLRHPSAYFDEPLTQQYDEGVPSFGTAEAEKGLYTPGTITIDNSINFLKGFFKITGVLDGKHGVDCTPAIKKDMSKYF